MKKRIIIEIDVKCSKDNDLDFLGIQEALANYSDLDPNIRFLKYEIEDVDSDFLPPITKRYNRIYNAWLKFVLDWRSVYDLCYISENEEWATAMEQTWAIWQGLTDAPKGWPK